MRITAKPPSLLGHRKKYTIAYFNTENIYFSDDSIDSDVLYAETVKILKFSKGLSIKAVSCDGVNYINIEYGQLVGIKVIDPDEFEMPERDKPSLSSLFFGWAQGLSSLHAAKLKIGGRIELLYKDNGNQQQIILYHAKQDIFDMFKYIRRHFKEYIL